MTNIYRLLLTLCLGLFLSFEVSAACETFPANVRFSDIQANGAVVSWQGFGSNYVYQVSWRVKNTVAWKNSAVLNHPTVRFSLTNLLAGSEYEVQVRSRCTNERNFAPYSVTSMAFRTLNAPPGSCLAKSPASPAEVKITNTGKDFAVLKWRNLPDAKGTAIIYGLPKESTSKWKEVLLCGASDSLILRNLLPNTTYRVRVRTLCTQCSTQNNGNKMSGWASIADFKTLTNVTEPQKIVGGMVYNDELQPVSNATITVGTQSTKTDAKGRYYLRYTWKERTLVKVEHPNYLTRTVGFTPTKADTVFCSVLVGQFKVTHTFNGKDAMLLGNTAFTIQLQENSIIDQTTGQPYTGTVKACIQSARPGDPLFGERMPGGDFLAVNSQGQERILYSYGFFGCELRGDNNQKLNLAPGKKAKVAFQITDEQQTNALPTMPLWHFDEAATLWKEEGTATRQGNTYIGEVSHFSSWNCDWQGPRCWVEGYVEDCNGKRVKGGVIYIDGVSATTDDNGFYRMWVPAGFSYPFSIIAGGKKQYELPANLTPDQTYQIQLITNYSPITLASGYYIGNQITLTAFLPGYQPGQTPVEFSLDGINWQVSNIFPDLLPSESYTGHIRIRNMSCSASVILKRNNLVNHTCGLVPDVRLLSNTPDIEAYLFYLNSPNPIQHGINLSNTDSRSFNSFLENYGLMGCLNHIDFSYSYIPDNRTEEFNPQIMNYLIGLPNLQRFKLTTNAKNWSYIFSSLAQFPSLEYLELPQADRSTMPQEIAFLGRLKYLHIDKSNSSPPRVYLPSEIRFLSSLKGLILGSCDIYNGDLPAEIGSLTRLNFLNFMNCGGVKNLPGSIYNLPNLDTLWFQGCTGFANKTLPKEIKKLTRLTQLIVSGEIDSIPTEIGNIISLRDLKLSSNTLTALPPSIANLKNTLTYLNLQGCPISEVEKARIRAWLPNTTIYF